MVLCLAAVAASAQTAPTVTIDPAGENARVRLSPLTPDAEARFVKTFAIPRYAEYRPYSLLLTNGSDQPIVAITVRWTITSGERTGFYESRSDSFGLGSASGAGSSVRLPLPRRDEAQNAPRPPLPLGESHSSTAGMVAGPGGRLLVAPGLFLRETQAKERGTPGASSGFPEAFRSATAITVSLDTVILQDGEVLGPDNSHTVDAVKDSKAQIESLLTLVRAAQANGQDPTAALRDIANARPNRDGTGPSMQQRMLARRLMSSTDWMNQLERLAATLLPNFHR